MISPCALCALWLLIYMKTDIATWWSRLLCLSNWNSCPHYRP